jgi:hypothetical protein
VLTDALFFLQGRAGELAANAGELAAVTHDRMADHLATVLTARYAAELAAWTGEHDDELRRRLRALRELCHDVVELQRGQQNAARLKIEQARLDRDREKTEEDITATFLRFLEYPKVRDCALDEFASLAEKKARLLELFTQKPDDSESSSEDSLFVHEVHEVHEVHPIDPDPDEPPTPLEQPPTDTEIKPN